MWTKAMFLIYQLLFFGIYFSVPSVVLNLRSTGQESTVITASWTKPTGNHSGYNYCLYESSDCATSNCPTNGTITTAESIKEENLTDGTMYCLRVAALTNNDNLPGDTVVIPAYTSESHAQLLHRGISYHAYQLQLTLMLSSFVKVECELTVKQVETISTIE